jgi:undecaprenyl-diphosphatase
VAAVVAVVVAAVLACGLAVVALAEATLAAPGADPLDAELAAWVTRHRTPSATTALRAVTRLADGWVAALVSCAAVAAWTVRRRPGLGVAVAASSATAATATWLLKGAFGRERPPPLGRLAHAAGDAFPSGHAAQSVACWGALALAVAVSAPRAWVRRAALVAAPVLALAVGASRVYLGVHWPSDVVSGWAVGLAALVAVASTAWLLRRLDRPRRWWGRAPAG